MGNIKDAMPTGGNGEVPNVAVVENYHWLVVQQANTIASSKLFDKPPHYVSRCIKNILKQFSYPQRKHYYKNLAGSQFHEINNSTDVENEKIQTEKFQKTNY